MIYCKNKKRNLAMIDHDMQEIEIDADMRDAGEDREPEAEGLPDMHDISGDCALPEGQAPTDPEAPAELTDQEKAAALPLNDFGNGRRLAIYYGEDMLFVPRLGWFRWGGQRWEADEDEITVRRDAQDLGQLINAEAGCLVLEDWQMAALEAWKLKKRDYNRLSRDKYKGTASDDDLAQMEEMEPMREAGLAAEKALGAKRRKHEAWAVNSGNSGKIENMLKEARVGLAAAIHDLNVDPLAVCCENGVLRFARVQDEHEAGWTKRPIYRASVRLDDHARGDRITKMMRAPYDPAAPRPAFDAFLETVQPDPIMRGFLKRWFGYSMTGLTSEQCLAFLFGGGRNGKSTLVDILAKIFADYGTTVPIETLTGSEQRKGSDATPDLVRLPGARMVRASEPEQGQRMKEALVKSLTGGEAILIRRMMQEFVEITPEFKLTISGNHKPEIRGGDDGIWRRILLVGFDVQIADADVNKDLPALLWEERAGIFAWLVEGCLEYLEFGLGVPDAVRAATEEYRKDSDPLRVFLTEDCTWSADPGAFTSGRDLADGFNAFLLGRGESVWGRRTVANQIKARSATMKGPGGRMMRWGKKSDTGYFGIELSQEARDRIAKYGEEIRAGAGRKG